MSDTATTITLIDYYADWCGPCRAMEPILHELEHQYAGKVKFEKVDVDKEQEKAQAANVMNLPTFHIVKDGKVVKDMFGYQSKDVMAKELDAALAS